ncbi:MAG: deoxyribonuclease IV [Deltaproteobacteria bacterium]|nr:MAG: deoxyribonuclease IV [Deltaproteobacteria bacterium]
MPLFGAHMSTAGGLYKAFERAHRVQAEALQIFTRNQRQWAVPPLGDEERAAFMAAHGEWGNRPLAAHGSYLINLANPRKEAVSRSIGALCEEISRCSRLHIPYLIIHPGAHMGSGVEAGLSAVTKSLDEAVEKAACRDVTVLLETTAGQGTGLGSRFEEIAYSLEKSRFGDQLGVCFDTCHAFAAGYDIRTRETYEKTFQEFDSLIGLERLRFFHLNDSKRELASRIDRHDHIGKGKIGTGGFSLLVNDARFKNHPMVLETPKGKDLAEDRRNLRLLRSLVGKNR